MSPPGEPEATGSSAGEAEPGPAAPADGGTAPAPAPAPAEAGSMSAGPTAGAEPAETGRSLVDPGPHDLLLMALSLGLVLRGVLGLADAWSLGATGVRFIGLEATMSLGGGSIGWSAGWGAAAVAAGLLLLRRQALGWLVAVAACVAYLITGIGEVAQVTGPSSTSSATGLSLGVWLFFLVDLAVPAILLALLFTVRPWFLAVSRSR